MTHLYDFEDVDESTPLHQQNFSIEAGLEELLL